ncbi:MAG TPA: aspartate-semialdehyde dehydrogenase [Deltaproteobacteria bacterium]|nr:aspartate-semialdehyde dehydrogenase [Deltaproteobacteria bacterium]
MARVAFIGWRGMVGSVLMDRMIAQDDFHGFEPVFFTTSQVGGKGPDIGTAIPALKDAYDLEGLKAADIIVTCQGSDHTKEVHPKLRAAGWKGCWIDASSGLRMKDDSIIILDPVNRDVIDAGLRKGVRDYIGGNCTVSLMLMAIGGLFKEGLVEWVTSMTYQAASGAGAKNMRELVEQMAFIGKASQKLLDEPATAALELDRLVLGALHDDAFPRQVFGYPLAANVLPWIDSAMENGQSREEWKGIAETNKILNTEKTIPVDGICVRVSSMRCHSQGLTIKLKRDLPLAEITDIIGSANDWVRVIPNTKEETLRRLTPAAVTGKLEVPVGRIRKMNLGPEYLTCYTVGDQLLWGAAEPIRRMLRIVLDFIS